MPQYAPKPNQSQEDRNKREFMAMAVSMACIGSLDRLSQGHLSEVDIKVLKNNLESLYKAISS